MLVISFSIAVNEEHADEVQERLDLEYGVYITHKATYTETLYRDEPETRVYFECYVPFARFESVTDWLDNKFTGTAILSY
jgi:hypothetical protein